MKRLLATASAIATLGLATPGYAFDWNGFYAGLGLGYSSGEADVHYVLDVPGTYDFSMAPAGWFGGVTAGFNHSMSGVVVGAEADLSLADITDTVPDVISPGETVTSTTDWTGSLRARLGWDGGDFMPYLTAGVVAAHVNSSGTDGPGVEEDATLFGGVAGAGVEVGVADNVTVKGEALYSWFGEHTWYEGEMYENVSTSHSASIRGGVNFHFD
jgi:opacity protein-like surface antigen